MGYRNAERVAQEWAVQLRGNRTAMLTLTFMAISSQDNGTHPVYFRGWEYLADALGLEGGDESRKRGVLRSIAMLVKVGAVKYGRPKAPDRNAEYLLMLDGLTGDSYSHLSGDVTGDSYSHLSSDVTDGSGDSGSPEQVTLGVTYRELQRNTRASSTSNTARRDVRAQPADPPSSRPPVSQPSPVVPPETSQPATQPGAPKPGTSPGTTRPRHTMQIVFLYAPQTDRSDKPDEVCMRLSWVGGGNWLKTHDLYAQWHRTRKLYTISAARLPDLMAMAQAEHILVRDHRDRQAAS